MEFLDENPLVKIGAEHLLSKFEKHIEYLKKTDVEAFRRQIEESPDLQTKSQRLRNLLEQNVPASLDLLKWLLEKHKRDALLYLEWMSHRQHVAMCLESFSKARTIAEEAHAMAKNLYQNLENSSGDAMLPREPTYKAYIKACVNLLLVCRFQGKITDAEVYLEEAKGVAKAEKDKDDEQLLLILNGDLLLARGQLNKAIDTIFTPLLRKPNMSLGNKGLLLQKFGNACRSAARWGLAKKYLRQSIKIAQDLGDLISKFDRVTDLGNVYRSEGRIADALEQQIPHMGFAFKRGDLWGLTVACFNMGFAYYSITPKPELKRALVLLSLKHDLAARTENEPFRGMALNNLGKTFCALGQYEVTLKVLAQSLEIAQKTFNAASEGMVYGNIGTTHRFLGNYDEAIENHNKYLENAMRRGDDGGVAIMQRELAIDYLCKEDFENAEKQARDAISTLETIRNKLDGEDASKIANFDKNQSETYNILQVILSRQGKHSEALALSELARSRALTDLIRDKLIKTSGVQTDSWIYDSDFVLRSEDLASDISFDFMKSADELNTNFLVYSVVKDYEFDGSPQLWLFIWLVLNDKAANRVDRIRFQRLPLNENIKGELMVDSGFFASLTRSFRVLSKDGNVQNNLTKSSTEKTEPELEDETVRVEIPEGPEVEDLLQLLKSLSLTEMTPPKNTAKEIPREEVHLNRDLVQQSDDSATSKKEKPGVNRSDMGLQRVMECGSWAEDSYKQLLQLYEVCIAPINDYLPDTTDGVAPNVTIIPHEFLFSVPFCCLHDGDKRYFVERFVLSYAPSLRALLLLNQRLNYLKSKQGNRKLKILAMGDPTMVLDNVVDLPYSGEEVKNVQAVFGPELCQIALRNDATKSLLLRELKNIDILHVATHACPQDDEVSDEKPQGDYSMRGYLMLAKSEEGCKGLVKASEIAATNCTCQLITLSCCETGLGKVTGDGVVGLYRSFFAAGAASVLVTLWEIHDDVTTIFMEHFYNEFKASGNVAGSLRSAMLYCIREKKLPPNDWAAFSFIGAIA